MAFRNEKICKVFEQIRDLRRRQGQEQRAKAYERAIPILRSHHKDVESGAEARQIYGIGASMEAKIDEILRTGTLAELTGGPLHSLTGGTLTITPGVAGLNIITQAPTDQEKERVLKLFTSIEGVGDKTAERFYAKGYRKLEDIKPEDCTARQWSGIQLHSELTQRIPRDEIEEFEKELHKLLDPQGIEFCISGSYRRGCKDSGDIDILVKAKPGVPVVDEVLKCPMFVKQLAYGVKKYNGLCKIRQLHRRVDIELTLPHEWAYCVLYFTGPGKFNEMMRAHCKKNNLRLNEKGLFNLKGEFYPAQSEEEIFKMLGLKYLTPAERQQYA